MSALHFIELKKLLSCYWQKKHKKDKHPDIFTDYHSQHSFQKSTSFKKFSVTGCTLTRLKSNNGKTMLQFYHECIETPKQHSGIFLLNFCITCRRPHVLWLCNLHGYICICGVYWTYIVMFAKEGDTPTRNSQPLSLVLLIDKTDVLPIKHINSGLAILGQQNYIGKTSTLN